ncbi:hypothetical protein HYZ97_02785 [Candidatus Pacearchaeota archaeon]|nr:hypothetical protein [Candidatus Pacearchaeota archaeon]
MPEVLSPSDKPISPKTADDINDLFNTIDEETPLEKKETVKTKPEKEEPAEADELELVEPDEDTEKLDLTKPDEDLDIDAPPRKKEILAKFPDLFKTFPFLEKILYRDRQYSELFGSFDDAKEIAEKSEIFNNFESQLLDGNTREILKEVKSSDERAFNIIVDEYLPALAEVDREAYFHVVGNLNRRLIMEMVKEANDTDNDDLKQAALLVNQFIFGTSKFTAPTLRVDRSKEEKTDEVEQERISFVRERFESARDDLQSRVDNTLRATISDYIDPRGAMSPYVKRNAVADAMKILGELISSDSSVTSNLDKLWRSAFDSKFSRDSLGRIQSFYLSKAKGNLKSAILKARAEALKDSRPEGRTKETDEEEEETTPRRRGPITPGKPSNRTGKNEMKKGESVTDFFMRD